MASVYKSLSKVDTADDGDDSSIKKNKQRVLVLTSRGVTYRQRHLLNDLITMLPHGRKDAKMDTKSKLYNLNEVAELYNCNNILFFEARKRQDLYMWLSKAPNGPSIKMHVQNLHTMEELHFTGNALKGSRPILSFDKTFDGEPHTMLIKEMLVHTFGVPKGARKSKPFIDHVLSFTYADGKVWFRNFQIAESEPLKASDTTADGEDGEGQPAPKKSKKTSSSSSRHAAKTELSLVEIGPRFVLTPIVILEGSFGGPVIYENKEFISPNAVRAEVKNKKAQKYNDRAKADAERAVKRKELKMDTGPERGDLDEDMLFA
ncbi:Brix domain-containing protein [Peziza echinospora]|nr:Brix domain-containing protein [Peziza echinospora]